MAEDCFFCKFYRDKAEEAFLENEEFFAIYDANPVSKGHALIIPKFHVASISELSSQQVGELFSLLNKVKEIIKEKYNPDGFNIGINEGEAAGQTIFHLHVHLMPRYSGDVLNPIGGVRSIFPDKADYTKNKIV